MIMKAIIAPKNIAIVLAALAAWAIAFAPFAAQAQQYSYTTLLNNSPIPAGGSTNLFVTLTKYNEVGLDISFRSMSASSTSNLTVTVAKSFDGSNFETTAGISFTSALTGTTAKRYCTNFTVGPVGYLRITLANGDSAVAMTNVTVRAYTKPNRLE